MKRLLIIFTIFLTTCILFSSCRFIRKIREPKKIEKEIVEKTFRKDGLVFLYPDDWKISKDRFSEKNVRRIVVIDDYTSICRISVFPLETNINLKSYAEKTEKNLLENIPIMDVSKGEIEDITREFQGINFDGVRLHRLISLFGTKVPHTTDFFLVQNKKYKVVISVEAVNEEWKAADKEFQLILDSLNFES